jgi:hypothetical protein
VAAPPTTIPATADAIIAATAHAIITQEGLITTVSSAIKDEAAT